ncbi:NERD domain-containing protein [Fredinandcohnia sp. QZ13]|uniref:nuclease-related domain-containing protein n=1 Tax=Fredinandcohnia sp. QZ13 TaxID=3073144 RepID=UPI002852FDD9|nr:NERD domain-containing protein [Fredinandcohnia sp. QZ13]MDR4889289.1 NERD domain-containing protein [Fredinandcohnia sp. QZ13]
MIKKELEMPLRLRKLEALLRRVDEFHPKYAEIREEFRKRMSGYRGEQSLKYYLSFLKEKDYLTLHNLRLPDISGEHFFEIDILLMSPTYILIIDAKNYRGELYFDGKFEQLIQTIDDRKKAYSCPIAQINRHQLQFRRLLQQLKFPPILSESLVVFTNPTSIISASKGHNQIQKVIKSTSFLSRIELFEKRHKKIIYEKKQLQKLSKSLLKKHTPFDGDILKQFGINQKDLIKGVACPKCDKLPMYRTERQWHCKYCQHSSNKAYLESIIDYQLIISNTITNSQLRDFLNLPSPTAARNILYSLQLKHAGTRRHRVYFFNEI